MKQVEQLLLLIALLLVYALDDIVNQVILLQLGLVQDWLTKDVILLQLVLMPAHQVIVLLLLAQVLDIKQDINLLPLAQVLEIQWVLILFLLEHVYLAVNQIVQSHCLHIMTALQMKILISQVAVRFMLNLLDQAQHQMLYSTMHVVEK
jgi:hypothetical protein